RCRFIPRSEEWNASADEAMPRRGAPCRRARRAASQQHTRSRRTTMSLLECKDLVKVYPGGKRAVDGVSFHVEPGEVVGLLGPNGAGKSTTFRMACGLNNPTEGRVELNGIDVTDWPMYKRARHGLGYLPQD